MFELSRKDRPTTSPIGMKVPFDQSPMPRNTAQHRTFLYVPLPHMAAAQDAIVNAPAPIANASFVTTLVANATWGMMKTVPPATRLPSLDSPTRRAV